MTVPCVAVERQAGEATRQRLAEAGLLATEWDIDVDGEQVYIPVTDPTAVPGDLHVVDHDAPERQTQQMPADLLGWEPSYERLGDLAIIDEDDPDRADAIADALWQSDLPIDGVLNRASKVKGETRTRDWDVLRGSSTQTVHREYGAEFLLDVDSVYFSPRLATERHRVVTQVEPDEQAFDMFAGVGPFVIPMAKRGATVIGTDVNEVAIDFLRENARRNGVEDRVTAIAGDVRDVAPEYENWADRLVMNLPHSADEFLDTAVSLAGEHARLHYYDIQHESAPFEPGEAAIRDAAEPEYEVSVRTRHEVRTYAPHEVNVVLDVDLDRVD
ncbi:class I SAM-dependent methyltransferase family protein [Halodesulfurarchaeum sp. HSR-GB]|uniref:class I SAM-dependent methyltransferase n=1 Tax=Halodesulfurarchaeum sp. HSR-GB TaxID=3074077 RepID=UPI002854C747|nr:class I SAM-dependent methyltransferase family protein [Halodesulfurarchaeum sp. HSR-GB]MDR5657162.1 class I SAM-dependent methyltransferase family protein [Halodesulfurarchaeum sp. HSR-GB]